MKKLMHGKTLALILAITTTLQLTGVTSQLLNGVPLVAANAATIQMGNTTTAIVNVNGVITSGQVTLVTSLPVNKTLLELNSSYNMLTFQLQVTTSGGVTTSTTTASVNWSSSSVNTATCSGTLTHFGIYQLNDTLNYTYNVAIQTTPTITGPTAVRITGRERVGKDLEAELRKSDGTEFTTSAGVVYKWYRLDHKNDDIADGKLVENEKKYKLVGRDKDNYIKLIVTYNGNTFTDITGDIDKRSSSHSSSRSNDDDDDDDTRRNNKDNISQAHVEKNENGFKIIENGRPVSGWKQINGQWYLADLLGNVQTGWKQINNVWYLLNNEGVMTTGWQQDGGVWYLLNNNGGMLTGWQLVGGKWYLLHDNGAMATGWKQSNGKWYYLYSDGSMANATVINGYRVDMTGAWIR